MNIIKTIVTLFTIAGTLLAQSQIEFTDVTNEVGLINPLKNIMGHSVAWGDINDDGYPDLFFGGFGDYADYPTTDRLLINNQGNYFTEILDSPVRLNGTGDCSGSAFADFDNDGDLDLIVTHLAVSWVWPPNPNIWPRTQISNFIYENMGDAVFKDRTDGSNIYFDAPFCARNPFVIDFDGDGLLDIFFQQDNVLKEGNCKGNSILMRNLGNFEFEDVTNEAGIPDGVYGLGGAVGDINGDSWPDIFFSHSCRLFLNNGDGTFYETEYDFVPSEYTLPDTEGNYNWTAGADFGDLDNDGDLDLVIGDHFEEFGPHHIRIYLNNGNDSTNAPIFEEITKASSVGIWATRMPHIEIQDFDNDGWMDILIGSQLGLVYRNEGLNSGIPRFSGPDGVSNAGGLNYWPSAPAADYNRDGKLDLMGTQWELDYYSPLMKNTTSNSGNYLNVWITDPGAGNRHGIGATVRIFEPGKQGDLSGVLGTQVISVSNGYSSGTEAVAHFGISNYSRVDIEVVMPANGPVYTANAVAVNQSVYLPLSSTSTKKTQNIEVSSLLKLYINQVDVGFNFYAKFPNAGAYTLKVYNINGQLIWRNNGSVAGEEERFIQWYNKIASGFYVALLTHNGRHIVKKMMKIK